MDYINNIVTFLGGIETLIAAFVSVAITGYVAYLKIKKIIDKNEAKDDFAALAAPFIAENEYSPTGLLDKLINPPIANSPRIANSNAGKALIAAQASIEQAKKEKPTILKRLGIHSAADAVPIVTALYQNLLKPILKKK